MKLSGDMGKRRISQTPCGVQKKMKSTVPSLAELGSLSSGGSRGSQEAAGTDGNVHLYIQQYCTDGSIYQSTLDPGRLLSVYPRCDARPHPLYKFTQIVDKYDQSIKQKTPETEEPLTMEELQAEFRMAHVFYGKKQFDQDGVGFKVRS